MRRLMPVFVAVIALLVLAACRPVTREGATAVTADPLAGTNWVLTELNGQPVLAETTVTLQFGADGSATGTDGCNNYGTSYTVDGTAVTFSPNGVATLMACPEPIMAQADAYQAALAGAATFTTDGSTLTLVDASGTTVAVFTAQSSDLAGTSWQVTNYNNGREAVVGVLADTTLTINFGASGSINGSGGCNNFMGSYESDGQGAIAIGPLASTMMACPEPEGAMAQEMEFLAALQSAATYSMDGAMLHMRTADDALAITAVPAQPQAAGDTGSETGAAGGALVTGTVTYLVRMALPEDAMVEVSIHNRQLADAPPEMTLLGMQAFLTEGQQVPIPYEVFYSPEDVMEGAMYSIGATIRDGAGNLLFVSTTAIPVITNGNPTENVEILVQPVQ
jgi:heat shock protein HslJ